MKVTAIKQQVKRTDRYSIFIEGKYKLSLTTAELADLGLHIGQSLSQAEIVNLDNESKTSLAKNNSLRLLSYRMRSLWEIKTYLKRKKYAQNVINDTIDYLTEKGFIDDQQFAKQWVENRLLLKSVSIRQLRQELRQKGIDRALIDETLDGQAIDEVAILKDLILKKRQQTKYQDDFKLMQYLARRGYSYEKIRVALRK